MARAPATTKAGTGSHAGLRSRRYPQARTDFGGGRLCALACPACRPKPERDLAAGKKVFADNCAVCHGADGKGNRELGAPNLTDKIWLYGSDKATIMRGPRNGRGGVMPAWGGRLSEPTIKALTVYVHTLGGGEK